MAPRPVDPNQSFPELEQQVLERWRERDVFAESLRRRQGAEPWVFYEGPPTANGRPGTHHVLARVFKDIYPRFKTMRGYYVERKGGWDCHGLPVEITVEEAARHLDQEGDRGVRDRGVQRQVPRVGLRVPRGLGPADRADRLLGRPRRRVPHARPELRRVRLVGAEDDLGQGAALRGPQGRALLPALRYGAVEPRGRARLPDVVDPSVYVRFPVPAGGGPLQPGDELLVWTTTPWTLVSNAAVAVDPELTYVRAPRRRRSGARRSPRRSSSGCSARAPRSSTRFPGSALVGLRYEPPFPFIAARGVRRARPHRAARRLRHRRRRHRPRPHGDRLRRGRLPPRPARRASTSSTRCVSTAPTTSASAPTRGASSRTPTRTSSRTCARAGGCCAPRSTSTPTRTAGAAARRCSITPSRRWYIATSTLRDRLLANNDDDQLAPAAHPRRALRRVAARQRRLGALA